MRAYIKFKVDIIIHHIVHFVQVFFKKINVIIVHFSIVLTILYLHIGNTIIVYRQYFFYFYTTCIIKKDRAITTLSFLLKNLFD